MTLAGIPIHLRTQNGQYLCTEDGGGGPVVANRHVAVDWETFGLHDANGAELVSGDPVALQAYDGHFVCAESGGGGPVMANRSVAAEWETLRLTNLAGGRVSGQDQVHLRASNGKFLCAEGGGGTVVVANRDVPAIWETFTLEKARHDGLLITSPPGPVFVMEDGLRRGIPNALTFNARGLSWEHIWFIPQAEMDTIPIGPPIPSVTRLVIDTGDKDMGWGHFMNTRAGFAVDTGLILAVTKIWTVTLFGGFHGSVHLVLTDTDGLPVQDGMPTQRYGVDGTAIGQSSRTEAWSFQIDPTVASKVEHVTCFQSWAPDDFATVLAKWKAAGETIEKLVTAAGGIAKIAAAIAA